MPNLFMVDLLGTEILEEEIAILQHPNVGALLLFTRNFTNPVQLKSLIEMVRSIRPDIFIAVDHEGGIVQRFQRHGFRSLPAARVYGDVFDLNAEAGIQLAQQYGELMARDLLAYGIDLSLAPVLDIHDVSNVIAKLDRAFHHKPEVVVELATAFIRGMNKVGMPAVGKHFPGHGSIFSDSHTSMPISDATEDELRNGDLKPFITLIGQNSLAAVMPAHVTYTAIDPSQSAGFSKIWLQDILRDELKFQGLVLSDCLGMAGADIGDINARSNQALEAGCDMLIVCNQTRALLYEVLQTITFEQSLASMQRIETFKSNMARFAQGTTARMTPYLPFTLHGATDRASDNLSELHVSEMLNNTSTI